MSRTTLFIAALFVSAVAVSAEAEYHTKLRNKLAEKFSSMDKDGDGHLDKAEIGEHLKAVGKDTEEKRERLIAAEASSAFAKLTTRGGNAFADENGDSKLGRAELQALRAKIIKIETNPEQHNKGANNEDLQSMAYWLHAFPETGSSGGTFDTTMLQSFEHNFAFADADGDSKLDATEFVTMFDPYHGKRTQEFYLSQSREYFERADANHDKSVTKAEWIAMAPEKSDRPDVTKADMERNMGKHFDKKDEDGDGKLSAAEFAGLFNPKAAWNSEKQHKHDLEFLFGSGEHDSSADKDKDGKLSKGELMESSSSVLGRLVPEHEIQDRVEL
eukprot:g1353.t1